MANDADTPWYADGLRFECTQCGACCTGPTGFVRYSDSEAEGMAKRLGITVSEFSDRYTMMTPAGRSLAEVRTEHGFDCIFLDRETHPGKAVCSLYEDRPTQCRTFPWWPANIASKRAWNALAKGCEGVNRGGIVPSEEILVQLRVQIAKDRGATPA
ncbi:MAG: YkgJ family cysteine cluster protein [Planctomycetota bacterium]